MVWGVSEEDSLGSKGWEVSEDSRIFSIHSSEEGHPEENDILKTSDEMSRSI
jgi:hypothetical protein